VVRPLPGDQVLIWLIKHAMAALMPRSDELPGILDTDLDGFLRRMHEEADPLYWTGLVMGTVVYAISPLLTVFVPLPSFLLPAKLRARHTERLLSHPLYLLRQAGYLVRLSAGMCWGADPTVRAKFALAPYPADPGTFRTS
jgi:hypothetical protein